MDGVLRSSGLICRISKDAEDGCRLSMLRDGGGEGGEEVLGFIQPEVSALWPESCHKCAGKWETLTLKLAQTSGSEAFDAAFGPTVKRDTS
jgi:hypothetical protein